MRYGDEESVAAFAHLESGWTVWLEQRLLDVVDRALSCTACQQVLWSLEDEIPPKMGKDNDVDGMG